MVESKHKTKSSVAEEFAIGKSTVKKTKKELLQLIITDCMHGRVLLKSKFSHYYALLV